MKIAVVGKGNVGGGLADRWEQAGHDVTASGPFFYRMAPPNEL
jgi:predicted dinucleotide-binding enzyme